MQPQQLILNVQFSEYASFENFICQDLNKPLLQLLQQLFQQGVERSIATQMKFFYLHGQSKTGKTHLLQALCKQAERAGLRAVYLPLRDLSNANPKAVFENLEHTDLLCIDDLEQLANEESWQHELFHLFNRVRDKGGYLVSAAIDIPKKIELHLEDLRSRLQWGLMFRLHALDEQGLRQLLVQRTKQLGFELNPAVTDFILLRMSRDVASLLQIVDKLNEASWQNKKALTIPFVKKILSW